LSGNKSCPLRPWKLLWIFTGFLFFATAALIYICTAYRALAMPMDPDNSRNLSTPVAPHWFVLLLHGLPSG
jgi:quinol-cytochrome oxidoreductase complex cytochrome b subunit